MLTVAPAKAGDQGDRWSPWPLDSRFRGNDEDWFAAGHSVSHSPGEYRTFCRVEHCFQKSAFPAKVGIHQSGDGAVEEWVPAFAGNADFWLVEGYRSMPRDFGISR